MALGTNTTTTTTADVLIGQVWAPSVLAATEAKLFMAKRVLDFSDQAKGANRGDTVNIPEIANMTANNKTQGSQITLNANTETDINLAIDTWKETSFAVEDIVKVLSSYNLTKLYSEKSAYATKKAVDTSLMNLYSGLSQTVGTIGTDVTDANIVRGKQYLDDADAPEEDRFFVLAPSQEAAILKLDKFSLRTGPGWDPNNSPIITGKMGQLYGMEVDVTTNVVTAGSTVHNLIFQREAFSIAFAVSPRTQSNYVPEYLEWLTTTDSIYGVIESRDTFGVDFRT